MYNKLVALGLGGRPSLWSWATIFFVGHETHVLQFQVNCFDGVLRFVGHETIWGNMGFVAHEIEFLRVFIIGVE
jgi:hypothetical protein